MATSRDQLDHFSKRAKAEGYAARSVYKLEEIDKRWKLFKRGDRVLDLGCSPGSWTTYAANEVGPSGYVLGVDLKPVSISVPGYAETRVADIYDCSSGLIDVKSYNVVLSDMAPSTTGHRDTDTARSAGLAEQALWLADRVLCQGGHVVVKLLEGRDIQAIILQMRATYDRVERLRPKATRSESSEVFLIGLGHKEGRKNDV